MTFRLLISFLLFFMIAGQSYAETGYVVKKLNGCDYFIIDAPTGYVVAEWYGGHDPSRGERVVGAFQNYGMITLFYGQTNQDGQVWLEDWGLSIDSAMEVLSEKCS